MRLTRIFVPEPLAAGTSLKLPAQAGEHLTRVLRLASGAPLTLFDGRGGEYSARLGDRNGKQVSAHVLAHQAIERESLLDVTLLQGIARGERMDFVVQKATELGVTRITPFTAERSVVRTDARQGERKRQHWQAVAVAACEQSGRNRVPPVGPPRSLDQALQEVQDDGLRCLLSAEAGEPLVALAGRTSGRAIVLLIGPEGGLSDAEEDLARARGFVACRLGPRVLRTETASLTALAALQAVAGDFIVPGGETL